MTKIYKISKLPADTLIIKDMPLVDYYDSYMVKNKTEDTIEKITEKILTFPKWVKIALRIRYFLIVKPFGLTTGRFDNATKSEELDFEPIPVLEKNINEIVMGADDRHLYHRISIMKKETECGSEIFLNTVVKFNNVWGKLYFLPVKIGHKLVVKSLLKRLTNCC